MLPKHKLALLIAGVKPRDEEKAPEEDSEDEGSYDSGLSSVAEGIIDAVKHGDKDALVSVLEELCEHIAAKDETEDEGE